MSPSNNGRSPWGPRFTAGYQFPRTDATGSMTRGQAVLSEGPIGVWQARVELVPLVGGRPNLFSVEAVWSHTGTGDSGSISCLVQGEPAREAYLRLVDHFKAGHEPPDAVPVPPGTPLL